jgi:RNA recognition motif-containing protein
MAMWYQQKLFLSILSRKSLNVYYCYLTCLYIGNTVILKGRCKGYGFILFETAAHASNAIEKLNALGFRASVAKESFSKKLKELQDVSSTNLYFSALPLSLTEHIFIEFLEPTVESCGGKVESVRILRDKKGRSKGVGFARFDERKTAEYVIEKMNGVNILGYVSCLFYL